MDEDFKRRWTDEAALIFFEKATGFNPSARKSAIATQLTMMVRSLPDGDFSSWGPREQAHAMERFHPVPHAGPHDDYSATAYRSIRLGHAVASRSTAGLSRAEAATVAPRLAILGVKPDPLPVPRAPAPGPSFGLDFAYTYLGVLKGGRSHRRFVATGVTNVERASADEFERAARLPRPGGFVEALVRTGTWYRPLHAPGGWEPVSEAAFVDACAGRDPWRDDPFRVARKGGLVAPSEYMTTPYRAVCREEAMADGLKAAGHLVSIDGVVHVSAPPPTFHLVLRGVATKGQRIVVGWRMGPLTSEDDMGVVAKVTNARRDWSSGSSLEGVDGDDHVFPTLPSQCADVVRDVARATALSSRIPFDDRAVAWVADTEADHGRVLLETLLGMPRAQDPSDRVAGFKSAIDGLDRAAATRSLADAVETIADSMETGNAGGVFVRRYESTLKALGATTAKAMRGGYEVERDEEAELTAFSP